MNKRRDEGVSHVAIWQKSLLVKANSRCKSLGAGECLAYFGVAMRSEWLERIQTDKWGH